MHNLWKYIYHFTEFSLNRFTSLLLLTVSNPRALFCDMNFEFWSVSMPRRQRKCRNSFAIQAQLVFGTSIVNREVDNSSTHFTDGRVIHSINNRVFFVEHVDITRSKRQKHRKFQNIIKKRSNERVERCFLLLRLTLKPIPLYLNIINTRPKNTYIFSGLNSRKRPGKKGVGKTYNIYIRRTRERKISVEYEWKLRRLKELWISYSLPEFREIEHTGRKWQNIWRTASYLGTHSERQSVA